MHGEKGPPTEHSSKRMAVLLIGAAALAVSRRRGRSAGPSRRRGRQPQRVTVKISIPAFDEGDATGSSSRVQVPKAGTTMGIDAPLHADPGQAAMDTANQRIAKLVGAKSVMEDAKLDPNKQLQIADSMLYRGFTPSPRTSSSRTRSTPSSLGAKKKGVPVCVEFSTTRAARRRTTCRQGARWPTTCTRSSRTVPRAPSSPTRRRR